MSEFIPRPSISNGTYPQKKETQLTELEENVVRFFKRLKAIFSKKKYSQKYVAHRVNTHQQKLTAYSEQELTQAIEQLRNELCHQGLNEMIIFKAFAVIREASARVLGKCHYNVQLYGGWLMINGMVAEMETGEGKTLTSTLPACTAALAGIPVHVITANDYLAARDCEIMLPLYKRLGINAAAVIEGMDTEQRRENYLADIVHTTNKQIAFDYLRDRIEIADDTGPLRFQYQQIQRQLPGNKPPLLLRGLCFALIDEADSVLIDEANTPLIITKTVPNNETAETYSDALYLASTLFIDDDFTLDHKSHLIELTPIGEEKLTDSILNLPKIWRNKRQREMLVTQALAANYCYEKDKHYLVKNDQIQIIDEATGRIMEGRAWEQGLHQMIEAKEGCVISELREPQARISYQRFFSRYLHLGGTSGTLSEVAAELHQVYDLDVIKVATYLPCQRHILGERIYRTDAIKKQVLIARVAELYQQKQPLLIGTCSVHESEQVSLWLRQNDIPHKVLNAKQDQHEAEIIAQAGQAHAITVVTNIAGRGTDIVLGDGVKELGGLHVIALSRNESRRVDRQLYGRCARQGDPGSAEAILSLNDPALEHYYSSAILSTLAKTAPADRPVPKLLSQLVLSLPQKKNERTQRQIREQLIKQDKQLQRVLAFSGKFE